MATSVRPSMPMGPVLGRPHLVAGIFIGLLLVGCGPSAPRTSTPVSSTQVSISNIDGPTVAVVIGGRELARLSCGSSTALDPAGEAGPLPWRIEFVREDGRVFGTVDEPSSNVLPYILVRADGVVAGNTPGIGPGPATCP